MPLTQKRKRPPRHVSRMDGPRLSRSGRVTVTNDSGARLSVSASGSMIVTLRRTDSDARKAFAKALERAAVTLDGGRVLRPILEPLDGGEYRAGTYCQVCGAERLGRECPSCGAYSAKGEQTPGKRVAVRYRLLFCAEIAEGVCAALNHEMSDGPIVAEAHGCVTVNVAGERSFTRDKDGLRLPEKPKPRVPAELRKKLRKPDVVVLSGGRIDRQAVDFHGTPVVAKDSDDSRGYLLGNPLIVAAHRTDVPDPPAELVESARLNQAARHVLSALYGR